MSVNTYFEIRYKLKKYLTSNLIMRITILLSLIVLVKSNIYYNFSNDNYNEVKNSRNFTGKVVLVTGSSSGIGEGIVRLFSILGANVVITARNSTDIERVAEEVEKLSPHKLKPLQVVADITKEEDVKRLVNTTIDRFGKIDVLVNNAGAAIFHNITDNNVLSNFDKMFNLNVRSIVQLIHESLPYLLKSKGNIINISSIASIIPIEGLLSYNMAKAALDMMTRILAIELGPQGIRVNAVNPGSIDTISGRDAKAEEMAKHMFEVLVKSTPLRRIGEPLDIAKAVAFLASNDANFITGANLVVDGGILYNFPKVFPH